MRRLLVFTENYARGGGNRYLIDTVNALAAEFDEVVIASNPGGIFPEDLKRLERAASARDLHFITRARVENGLARLPSALKKAVNLPLFLMEPLFFLYNTVVFASYLARLRPALAISCNGGWPGGRACLAFAAACRLTSVPAALTVVSTPMPRKRLLRFYEALIDRLAWRSADMVVVNAEAVASALAATRGMPLAKARVVHNGLEDAGDRVRNPVSKNALRGLTIGCIARTDRAKGVFILLDAFLRLAQRHPGITLRLAGKGDAHEELKRRVAASRFRDRIDLMGFFNGDAAGLLASFDVYVFPSLQEGFPYSILEAMAGGKAIAASAVGGIPEAVRDNVEGLLVEPGSVDALEGAIEMLILDEGLRARLAGAARARFAREFTLEAMRGRMREAFSGTGLLNAQGR